MSGDWREAIAKEWLARAHTRRDIAPFPLVSQSFDGDEIVSIVETLLSGRLTMDARVNEFEQRFARWIDAPYACMVNSGSSANLLAVSACANPARKVRLHAGDEVLVPSVCWSTSVWPILQLGLVPVFVDVEPGTLNICMKDLKRRITKRTRGLVAVHVLGNSCPMAELMQLAREHDWIIVEDTCESLGSRAGERYLGTLGDFGTYSFYYSHHITTGEGGMVVCHTLQDYDLLRCLRAHGWSRSLSDRSAVEARHHDIDPRFLFVNVGYNFRPMEVQAAMGLCQLDRIERMNRSRVENRDKLVSSLKHHPAWSGQLEFIEAAPGTAPIWFGFCALLREDLVENSRAYLTYLTGVGVENRPIVSGNFTRQPGLALMGVECNPLDYPGAERIHKAGFFIGVNTEPLSDELSNQLAGLLLGFDFV